MSFRLSISPSRRVATRFIEDVRRSLLKALEEARRASGMSQAQIAREIGVDRSVINRQLRGEADLTLGRVAEIAYILGWTPKFELVHPELGRGANIVAHETRLSSDQDFRFEGTREQEIYTSDNGRLCAL